ncbi:hypothetical protein U27_05031 [Candidatus Vecturithrix granuli]|uniref:Uncharacterized protein n=1 Tax=Vecturithrix granuli TaxID=1499967 RepID=A0A081C0F3_VECG1|nr:hypothetical protein U27_05031 [Candidatus Vecturithrix granuli]
MINSYMYGEIIINRRRYVTDLIIYPDRIDVDWGWQRSSEHTVTITDLSAIIAEHPQYVIIGTGNAGRLRVLSETQEYVRACGIQLVSLPTWRACLLYNKIGAKGTVGAFHIGC